MENRATGKTFRLVLRALADASEGKFVVFVSKYRSEGFPVTYAFHTVKVLSKGGAAYFHTVREMRFPSTEGVIKFTCLEEFVLDLRHGVYAGRDWRKTKVVFDDCEPDQETQERLRAWLHG